MIERRSNITDQIVQYFKENIAEGVWKVGEKIPSENQLVSILGVNRASIRTAIQQLVGTGILESVHGKGTFLIDDQLDQIIDLENKITAQDCQDTLKVLEFRRIIESEACYMATEHVTPEVLKSLEISLETMKKCKKEKEEFVIADMAFHKAICKASDNTLIEKSMNRVFEENRKNHDQLLELFGYRDGIHYHSLILKAMKQGNAKLAKKMMYEHLQNAIEGLQE